MSDYNMNVINEQTEVIDRNLRKRLNSPFERMLVVSRLLIEFASENQMAKADLLDFVSDTIDVTQGADPTQNRN